MQLLFRKYENIQICQSSDVTMKIKIVKLLKLLHVQNDFH